MDSGRKAPEQPVPAAQPENRGNEDFRFASMHHAWASGLIAGVLVGSDQFEACPALDATNNQLPQVFVTVGERRYLVLVEELQ